MPLPTSQKTLLASVITKVDAARASLLQDGIELDQINVIFPGVPIAAENRTKVVFSWDVEANEFRVAT
jgi:hypothetical protein